jgi:hypothetical protein
MLLSATAAQYVEREKDKDGKQVVAAVVFGEEDEEEEEEGCSILRETEDEDAFRKGHTHYFCGCNDCF